MKPLRIRRPAWKPYRGQSARQHLAGQRTITTETLRVQEQYDAKDDSRQKKTSAVKQEAINNKTHPATGLDKLTHPFEQSIKHLNEYYDEFDRTTEETLTQVEKEINDFGKDYIVNMIRLNIYIFRAAKAEPKAEEPEDMDQDDPSPMEMKLVVAVITSETLDKYK